VRSSLLIQEDALIEYLSRPEAADYLTAKGLRVSKNTLGKLATVGGGPMFRKFGARVVYTEHDLEAWAKARLSDPVANTSSAA